MLLEGADIAAAAAEASTEVFDEDRNMPKTIVSTTEEATTTNHLRCLVNNIRRLLNVGEECAVVGIQEN